MNKSEKIIELVEKINKETTAVHIHPDGEHMADEYLRKNNIKHTKKKRKTALGSQFIYRFGYGFYPGFITSCAPHVCTTGTPSVSSASAAPAAATGGGVSATSASGSATNA